MRTFLAFFIAFFAAYISTFFFRRLAISLNVLDIPDHQRKVHKNPIPLFGGMGIYFGIVVAFFFFSESFRVVIPIFAGATVIFYMGAFDDIKGFSARLRLIIQILVSAFIVLSGIHISFLPANIIGRAIEILLTIIWIVGVTNAFNYLDGLDGLACGSAIINFLCFLVILYHTGQFEMGLAVAILIGACSGFFPHNFLRKDRMFLGDAGSMFLGFSLACIALTGNWASDNIVRLSIPVLILGVPIFDMIFTTVMRIREGKVKTIIEWLRYGGKDHFHHYLVDLGLTQRQVVFFIYYLTLSLGLGAIMVSNDTAKEGVLTILQSSIVFCVIGILIVMGKRSHHKHCEDKEE